MKIDWTALGIVSVVSIAATLMFVALLSFGVRFISAAKVAGSSGRGAGAVLSVGYAFIALAGLLVLFCLYLIVPQFH